MKVWFWISTILLAVGLAACAPEIPPTPQQTVETEIAEPVPVTVELVEPTLTATPTFTKTPQPSKEPPTNTPSPEHTATANLSTATPTSTILPINPTSPADISITNVILSSKGQLAYIQDEILYVETAPQTRKFEEIGRYALTASWAPDGTQIAYSTVNIPDTRNNDPNAIFDQRLWLVSDSQDISLSQLISNYPYPAPDVEKIHWTPDGKKLILAENLSDTEWEEYNHLYHYRLHIVDLDSGKINGEQLISSSQRIIWLTDDVYVLRSHCGSPCADISAYDHYGELVWSLPWVTGGFVDFAPTGNFMVNVGRINASKESIWPTLDKIDLLTGTVDVIFEIPTRDSYFTPFIMPTISPDEQLFTFNFGGGVENSGTLFVVNQNGNEYGQYDNSLLMDWFSDGKMILNKGLESGESQLQIVSLNGVPQSIFTTAQDVEITGGIWTPDSGGVLSPDEQSLMFILWDRDQNTTQIYLWRQDDREPYLVHSIGEDHLFRNPIWLPDSTGVYFTSGKSSWQHEAIWFYDVENDSLQLIAPQIN